MVEIFIIEDLADYRESISQLIDGTDGYQCCGAFSSFEAFQNYSQTCRPDVILCDINLPGISGIEGVKKIRNTLPHTEVIMLTVYDDSDSVFQSLQNGASGYILKTDDPARIIQAIHEVMNGGAPMSMSIARQVTESFRKSENKTKLSDQQLVVLIKLSEGKSYQAIANELFIEKTTVKYHIKNIYRKLQVNNKVNAVVKASNEGLI